MERLKRLGVALALLASSSACHATSSLPYSSDSSNSDVVAPGALGTQTARDGLRTPRTMAGSPVGSSNTVTADMPVPRPKTKPCVVKLFDRFVFDNFNNQPYNFTPPAACPAPWAKVVLNVDLSVQKGNQYDRTGIMWLDGAVVWFGTTAEPQSNLAPNWHVENDVTELSALFRSAGQGQVSLGNLISKKYGINSKIFGSAFVQFYPATRRYPAPHVADIVIGMPYSPPLGGATTLPNSPMQIATALPHNITQAYLDVYLQSQNAEEQWFMCVPTRVYNNSKKTFGFCPNTAFREGYVTVGSMPAGIAPIYPWIYTGGMNPGLWAPIPGIQTLNFKPYRVDLTPFASVLSSNPSPTIQVAAVNSFSWFTGAGDLLLFLDPKQSTVTGAVTTNTLKVPTYSTASNIIYGQGTGIGGQGVAGTGTTRVTASANYVIDGYVNTSSGKVSTAVSDNMQFSNTSSMTSISSAYVQKIYQVMTLKQRVQTTWRVTQTTDTFLQYPIQVSFQETLNKAGDIGLPVTVFQGYQKRVTQNSTAPFYKPVSSVLFNTLESSDSLVLNSKYYPISNKGNSSQLYTYYDSDGACYGHKIASKNNVVTADTMPSCFTAAPVPQPYP